MGFGDRELQCVDCGATFVFSAEEQELFAQKGYRNDPKRCLPCRQARRARRDATGNGEYRSHRQMYRTICAQCGKEAEVPFEPRQGRPVYCSECYSARSVR